MMNVIVGKQKGRKPHAVVISPAYQSLYQVLKSLVEKYGIMTVPAPMFEYTGNYLRIGFGRENFKEVIDMLCVK